MKKRFFAVMLLILLCVGGCSLSPRKIEGVWVFSEVNGASAAQYAAVMGRSTDELTHSYTISGKTAVLEDKDGQTELKMTMEKNGFTVVDDNELKRFYYDAEMDYLVYNTGEESWIYKKDN